MRSMPSVLLAVWTDCTDIGTIDVNGASQYCEVKTANERNSRVFVQFDGQLGVGIG